MDGWSGIRKFVLAEQATEVKSAARSLRRIPGLCVMTARVRGGMYN